MIRIQEPKEAEPIGTSREVRAEWPFPLEQMLNRLPCPNAHVSWRGAPLTGDVNMACHFSSEKGDRNYQGEIPSHQESKLCCGETLSFSPTILIPIPRTATSPRKRSIDHLGFKSCCVLRKSLTFSEPRKEEGDCHSFVQEISIELLLS